MLPFASSFGNEYVLLPIDYVSKWVEPVSIRTNETRIMERFLKRIPFLGMDALCYLVTTVRISAANHLIHC